ncbi:uncharacterized protein LOC130992562 [Salvia miltiorrhiza]|uniref:uncharacterized protein LOC130992562 n=1 Tax=Salvia miltiorrhiza TaxID=226208 RepID=UPI0025ACAC0A|nr:uncharacterized protein LOC130992562 [Salvia miltiorrhiza]
MTALDESSMREPLTSVKIHPRKRKKSCRSSPNPNLFTSVFTRSRSRIFHHQNRSGFSRPDPVTRKPIPAMESVEAFLDVNCRSASRILLTKDLRHKRVYSPSVNSVEEEIEENNEEQNKLLKGFDSSTVPDVDDAKEYELGTSGFMRSEVGDERIDGANGLKLKDQIIHGNGSLPKMKTALNGCQRRKVFKTPNSFSYRRLLPHLMDIVNDTSNVGVSKIELVDAGSLSRFRKLDGASFEPRSIAENSYAAKTECVAPQFNNSRKVHIKVSTIQLDSSGVDNELDRTAETIKPLEVKEKSHQNDMNGVDASVEESIQTTPPDPGILGKTEVCRGRESADAKNNLTFIGLPVGSEKNSSSGALKQSPDTKCGANSMNKTVLNPCSRLRLFRNPRSVSYRRLLPFLMDISKTDSCTTTKPQKKLPQVVSEEDRHPAPAIIAVNDFVNDTPKEKIGEKIYDGDRIQTASDGSSPDSNNNLVSSIPELPATNYSSNIDPRFVNSVSSSVSEPSSVISYIQTKQCTPGEPRSVEKQNMCLNMGLELSNGNTDSSEIVNLKQHSPQINTLYHLDALVPPKNRPFKGILKRNRRGCRGLCNCLNCASFRLHAERAFEFSRNQLLDAEEVASQLMKELANVRLLLEKSIIETDDSASIRPHPVLIKQACSRAIEAETLAKERLGELNNDLSVHCRIPDLLQPKVTFAHNNQ